MKLYQVCLHRSKNSWCGCQAGGKKALTKKLTFRRFSQHYTDICGENSISISYILCQKSWFGCTKFNFVNLACWLQVKVLLLNAACTGKKSWSYNMKWPKCMNIFIQCFSHLEVIHCALSVWAELAFTGPWIWRISVLFIVFSPTNVSVIYHGVFVLSEGLAPACQGPNLQNQKTHKFTSE